MRVVDKIERPSRRNFIARSAGVIALAGPVLASASALADTLGAVPADTAPTLVLMARDLYPHDRLPDDYYKAAVQTIATGVAADPNHKTLLTDGVKQLDAAAMRISNRPYLAIEKEQDRVAILKTIEDSAFFKAMRGGMVTAFYDQEPLWAKLGYEGSSAEHGGYLHRGFDDIDWLPA